MTRLALLLLLLLLPGRAEAAEIPRWVAGPASGLQQECRDAGQPVPKLETLVSTTADLDGDGQPDYVMDAGKGCEAVRLLYCDATGCSVSVYVSSIYGYAGGEKARRVTVDRTTRPASVLLVTGGTACGKPAEQECPLTLRWNGSAMAVAK